MLSIQLAEHKDQLILQHRFRPLHEWSPVSPSAAHCVDGEFLFIGHDAEVRVTSNGDVSGHISPQPDTGPLYADALDERLDEFRDDYRESVALMERIRETSLPL